MLSREVLERAHELAERYFRETGEEPDIGMWHDYIVPQAEQETKGTER